MLLLGCTAGLCSSLSIWVHGAFSVKQFPSFCGCKGLFFSRHWTLHFSLLNFNRFLLSYSSSLSRSLLKAVWLSSILAVLPKLGVIFIYDKQPLLQVIDKDVKCVWTQERRHGIPLVTSHKIE